MQARAVLKSITRQAPGSDALATVQLIGLGNLETFHDGYKVSHAIPQGLLVPGADVVVEIADVNHPGDGQVTAIAQISGTSPQSSSTAFPPDTALTQTGSLTFTFNGTTNFETATVTFPTAYASPPPFITAVANTIEYACSVDTVTATQANIRCFWTPGTNPTATVTAQWEARGTRVTPPPASSQTIQQDGTVSVNTDASGNGTATVTFPNTFGSFTQPPNLTLAAASSQLGTGTLTGTAISSTGFTAQLTGAATTNGAVTVSWDATGT